MLCFISWSFLQCRFLHGAPPGASHLKYRFEYTLQGEAGGVFLLLFPYRVFFCASASVLLTAEKSGEKTFGFNFTGIDKSGYLIITWGFSGKTLVTAAADYDLKRARQLLDKDFLIFKEKAPGFSRFIKRRKVFPYRIISRGKNVIKFKRDSDGIHRDCTVDIMLHALQYEKKYNLYFKIYPMLVEILKVYNHSFLPGDCKKVSQLRLNREWHSPPLDFTRIMNRLGKRAAWIVDRYITFKQRAPFRLTYRVVSAAPGKLTVEGEARPRVKIWGGFKIGRVTRTIESTMPGGLVLTDKFHVEIRNKKGKGGFARCALTLVR